MGDFIDPVKVGCKEQTLYGDLFACWQFVVCDSSSSYRRERWLERKLQREWRSTDSSEAFCAPKRHTVSRCTLKCNFAYAHKKNSHSHSTHFYRHFLYQISSISGWNMWKIRAISLTSLIKVRLSLHWFSRNLRIIQQHCV